MAPQSGRVATSAHMTVVFSIPIYECLTCAKRQFSNVLQQNDERCAIVVHR